MKSRKSVLIVKSSQPPVIESDAEAMAFYIYFQYPQKKVYKTIHQSVEEGEVNIDLDKKGEVIGVELIGAQELQVARLLKKANVDARAVDFSKSRYRVPTPATA